MRGIPRIANVTFIEDTLLLPWLLVQTHEQLLQIACHTLLDLPLMELWYARHSAAQAGATVHIVHIPLRLVKEGSRAHARHIP